MEEKVKRKFKMPKRLTIILYTALIAIVILLIAISAAQKLGNVTVSNMFANIRSYLMSMGSGDGYPYSIDAGSVFNISVNNSNLLLLTDDGTKMLTSTAKEVMPIEHSYANPVIKTNGSLAIVYDLDSGKFRLQNSSEVTLQKELPSRIMAAAVGKNGNYAVGTYGTDVQSVLTVYDSRDKEIFVWNFKSERISDIALSDNGKRAAVSTIYSKNGEINSKLYIFSFKSDKYEQCFDYPSTALVRIDYIKKNNIVAVGDNIRSYIKDGKTRTDTKFDSDNLRSYSVSEKGRSAIVFSKYGSTSLSSLKVYNSQNKEQFSKDFDEEVKWVSCDEKYTAVLFENEVKTYDKRGKEIGSITFSGEPERIVIDGGSTYLLTSASIQCYKTKGIQAEKTTQKEG